MSKFGPKEGSWDNWLMQFKSILAMIATAYSKLYVHFLIGSLALHALEELRRDCLPKNPNELGFNELLEKLQKLYGTRILLTKGRANIFKIKQSDSQKPRVFGNFLRKKAARRNFENFKTNSALVVQFVNSISDEIRQELAGGKASVVINC